MSEDNSKIVETENFAVHQSVTTAKGDVVTVGPVTSFSCMLPSEGYADQMDPNYIKQALQAGIKGITAKEHDAAAQEIIGQAKKALGGSLDLSAASEAELNTLTALCNAAVNIRLETRRY